MTATTPTCPLCQQKDTHHYSADKRREFIHCATCSLVFADPTTWPKSQDEKTEYDLHENNVTDPGYNKFLARIVEPLASRLSATADVLDFGCGPAPALAKQLEEQGLNVSLYDHFYHNDKTALTRDYDGIVMTEVIEHLHQPDQVLIQLWDLLLAKGCLAIMTQRVTNKEAFKAWQYKNDPTHVCFYSDETFKWLEDFLGAQAVEFVGRDMVFLVKGRD